MNCYFCHDAPEPGGMHLTDMSATGICKSCGAGVCHRHGQRSPAGSLVCPECRRAARKTLDEERKPVTAHSA